MVWVGNLIKVVIVCDVFVEFGVLFDVYGILLRFRVLFGFSYCYLVDGFFGVSLELLVEWRGDVLWLYLLVGIVSCMGDLVNDVCIVVGLIASMKD